MIWGNGSPVTFGGQQVCRHPCGRPDDWAKPKGTPTQEGSMEAAEAGARLLFFG